MRPSRTPSTMPASEPETKPTSTRVMLIDTSARISPLINIGIGGADHLDRRRDQERVEDEGRQQLPDRERDQQRGGGENDAAVAPAAEPHEPTASARIAPGKRGAPLAAVAHVHHRPRPLTEGVHADAARSSERATSGASSASIS